MSNERDEELLELEAEMNGTELPPEEPAVIEPDPAPETEPEVKAEDEAPAEENTAPNPEGEAEPKMVPLAAVHKERDKWRAAEERAKDLEAKFDKLAERLTSRVQPEPEKPQEPEAPPAPDLAAEPFDFMAHTAERVAALEKQQQETAEERQNREIMERFDRNMRAAEDQFKQDHADYPARLTHVLRRFAEGYTMRGASAGDAEAMAAQDLKQIAIQLATNNQNPIQYIYDMAVTSGYVEQNGDNSTLENQPSDPPKPAGPTAEEKDAMSSLSQASGASVKGIDLSAMLDLPEEQFFAELAKHGISEAQLKRMAASAG